MAGLHDSDDEDIQVLSPSSGGFQPPVSCQKIKSNNRGYCSMSN